MSSGVPGVPACCLCACSPLMRPCSLMCFQPFLLTWAGQCSSGRAGTVAHWWTACEHNTNLEGYPLHTDCVSLVHSCSMVRRHRSPPHGPVMLSLVRVYIMCMSMPCGRCTLSRTCVSLSRHHITRSHLIRSRLIVSEPSVALSSLSSTPLFIPYSSPH
jgi:hypothetical protein